MKTSAKDAASPVARWENRREISFSASLEFCPGTRESCEGKQSSAMFPLAQYRKINWGRAGKVPGERNHFHLRTGVDPSHTGASGGFPIPPEPRPHLCDGLEERQAEPLEEGEGAGAARHLHGCHGGDVGLQVAGDLLEDLGLVEIQFSLKEQRESSSRLHRSRAWTDSGTRESAKLFFRRRGGSESGISSPAGLGPILSAQTSLCCTHQLPISVTTQLQPLPGAGSRL